MPQATPIAGKQNAGDAVSIITVLRYMSCLAAGNDIHTHPTYAQTTSPCGSISVFKCRRYLAR